jgi:hypothetical protein
MIVTLRPDMLAAAEAEVASGRADSSRAGVGRALDEKVRRYELSGLLAEMRGENGPATDEDDAWARDVLGL